MRAAIFDMDGLLIDSEPSWRLAEQKVFARVGISLTDAMCEQTIGLRIDEVVAYWRQRFPWESPDPAEIEADIVTEVETLIRLRGVALPGVHTLLAALDEAGWPIALASSSPPELIEAVLDRLDLGSCFAIRCSASSETHGKPHPAVYLTTARRLGIEPVNCIALEDSMAGIRSAKAAGMRVVAVPAAEPSTDPRFNEADLVVGSLNELTPEILGRALGNRDA